jgi:alpha-glucosidase
MRGISIAKCCLPFLGALGLVLAPACSRGGDLAEDRVVSVRSLDTVVELHTSPFSLSVIENGNRVLTSLSAPDPERGAVMAAYELVEEAPRGLPGWDGYLSSPGPWGTASSAVVVEERPDFARLEVTCGSGKVMVSVGVRQKRVELSLEAQGSDSGNAWNKLGLSFATAPDEHFFGMGERFASTDHRGLSLYQWAEEGGVGKGESVKRSYDNPGPNGPSMTYFPVPFFLSSRGYAMHLDTTFRSVVDFAEKRPDALVLTADTPKLRTVIYTDPDPRGELGGFVADTGRPLVPAPWVFGARRRMNVNAVVEGVPEWKLVRDRDIPITTIDDAMHFLPASSEKGQEAQLATWTKTVHAAGYKVVAYANPYVATNATEIADDYAFGEKNGYFLKDETGAPGKTFFISGRLLDLASIDLTQPEAVAWFQSLLKRMLTVGYDGWMHDFGEYTARKWTSKDGRNGQELHNAYPVLSAKAAYELMQRERPNDLLFFVRSGYTGSSAFVPMVWGGDAEATFDETQGLPSSLRGGLNLGMSGVPVWGSDVSGYKCVTDAPNDKEIYLRWVEVGAVSPVFEEEDSCSNPVGKNKEKWSLFKDQETQDVYRAMTRLHTRLGLYLSSLAQEAHDTGMPITRHPFLVHPRLPESVAVEDSLYFGPALFASPVVRRGVTAKTLWLPPGRFVDFENNQVLDGGAAGRSVTVPAPLGKLPLWLTEGAVLPLYDATIDTLSPNAEDPTVVTPPRIADRLDVVIVPGKSGSFTLPDGTELSFANEGPLGDAPADFAKVDPQALAECSKCVVSAREGDVTRVRVNGALEPSTELRLGGLVLRSKSTVARRIRWDVRIPGT